MEMEGVRTKGREGGRYGARVGLLIKNSFNRYLQYKTVDTSLTSQQPHLLQIIYFPLFFCRAQLKRSGTGRPLRVFRR